jgi:stage II sporulation protein P
MIRIKTVRLSDLLYFLVILALSAGIIFLSWRLLSGNPIGRAQNPVNEEQPEEERFNEKELQEKASAVNPVYKAMFAGGFAAITAADGNSESLLSNMWNIMIRNEIRSPEKMLRYPLPYLEHTPEIPDNNAEAVEASNNLPDRSGTDRPDIPLDISRMDSDEQNQQEVSREIQIQVNQIEIDDSPIKMPGEGPKILIYHSHSREAYRQDSARPYKEAAAEAFRSDDHNHTVIQVGAVLAEHLRNKGISVLHDKTDHEKGDYNASYSKSLKTLQKRITEHDSLQLFIDIHRNAFNKKSRINPDDEVVIVDGKRVAKLMVVIGTGEGIVGGFSQKPNWKENAKLAIKLTNKLNELAPGLAKDVLYKTGRYTQHISTNAILVEVGSTHTTLTEAERATKYLAEAISQIIE